MKHPTRRQMMLVATVWLAATFLTLSVETDMFRKNDLVNWRNSVSIVTTVIVLAVLVSYFRDKRIKNRIS